ncbi:hypothetical protein ACSBR2_031179 [Camellia fascicularis]
MDIMMSTNLGNFIQLDYNYQSGRFKRHYRPLLFIDGTFMKGKYKGTLLTATTKDGDQELQDKGKGIVCRFLSNLPYDKWNDAYFKGQKYSEMH